MADKKAKKELMRAKVGGLHIVAWHNSASGKKYGQISRSTKDVNGDRRWQNVPIFAGDNIDEMIKGMEQLKEQLKASA